jgi:hypothetical protein
MSPRRPRRNRRTVEYAGGVSVRLQQGFDPAPQLGVRRALSVENGGLLGGIGSFYRSRKDRLNTLGIDRHANALR